MELVNKRIIITGGTAGIGYALVEKLSYQNDVIVIGRNADKLQALKDTMKVTIFQADLSSSADVINVGQEIARKYTRLDILINNAAVQYTPTFIDPCFRMETIEPEITLNLTTPCLLTALLLERLNHDKPSCIVNINSGLGLVPKTSSAVYCATKGGLNLFTKSLRHQLAHTNIRVYQAYMPLVDTSMTKGRGSGKLSPEEACNYILKGIVKNIPDHAFGKGKLLQFIMRLSPTLAENIMKEA